MVALRRPRGIACALTAPLLWARLLGAGAQREIQCGIVTVEAGGREGLLYVPPAICYGIEPKALLISAHGWLKNQWMEIEKWAATAEELNVVILAPVGHGRSFNAGSCCGQALGEGKDDLAMVEALAMEVLRLVFPAGDAEADIGKVVMTGFSNGGMLSAALALNATRWRPVAIAPVAAYVSHYPPVEAVAPTSVWIHHGTMDDVLPHAGCCAASPCCCGIPNATECQGAAHHFQFWLQVNQCNSFVQVPYDHVPGSECYLGVLCAKETRLCLYHGLGHEELAEGPPLAAESLAMLLRATGN